ncbi:MAG: hypothetical protein ACREEM_16240 [Blastocatellia bacterium]
MSENYEEIMGAAMTLAPGARAILAGHLLESINTAYWLVGKAEPTIVDHGNDSGPYSNQADRMSNSLLTLSLTPELEFGLSREAGCRGIHPERFALEALDEHVARSLQERVDQVAELFRQWNEEEVDESEALDDEFFRNLEENRVAFREVTLPD